MAAASTHESGELVVHVGGPRPTLEQLAREVRDLAIAVPLFATAPLLRPWHRRWGATDAEVAAVMPGDELVPGCQYRCTRAITIDAPPEAVWPWLVQVGFGKAGFYSNDLLDNVGHPSADRILDEFQNPKVGSWVPMFSKVNDTTAFKIAAIKSPEELVWTKPDSTWAWRLTEVGASTRLVTRLRILYRWQRPADALMSLVLNEFGDFPMMRKMLRTLKQRAESEMPAKGPAARRRESPAPGARPANLRGQRETTDRVTRLGKTPPFRGPHGGLVPGSIAEIAYQRLGGVDQWVMIRGESVANPPLILLHGGPGLSETAFLRYFNAPLEKSFTVVYWDQRGAGKSFDRRIPRSSMTVERLISDLDELVDIVCERLDKPKAVILGHSWGSALGTLYAARFPEKVEAYVGSAQVGDWAAAEAASYAWTLAEAQRVGNRTAVRKLRAIGPPPYPAAAVFTERTLVMRFEGAMRPRAMWKMARAVLGGQESSISELPRTWRGFRWTMEAMWAEVSCLNLIEQVPALQMPVFFLLGRNDHWIPPQTSVAYFEALTAPSKKLVWFEHSSHEMFVDEPDKFNAAMAEQVRPALPSDESTPGT